MNLLDMLIIAAICIFIIRGVIRGFFREIGSLAGVVLGICLGNAYQPEMTVYLQQNLPNFSYLPLISFTIIFLFVLFLSNLAGWGLSIMLKKVFMAWVDRTFGASLAVLKGVILTYLAIVLLTFFIPSQTPLVAKSALAPLIIRSYQSMVGVISPDFYRRWKNKLDANEKKQTNHIERAIENNRSTDES